MPGRRLLATLAAVAVVAAGCDADVATRFTVRSATSATARVEVTFAGEIAERVAQRPELAGRIVDVFAARGGVSPTVVTRGGTRVYRAEVPYDRLVGAAGITGVAAASVAADPAGARLTVRVSKPAELAEAVEAAAAGQPDADALAATMLAQTTVTVSVTFPGGIAAVDAGGLPAERDGRTVTVRQRLAGFADGTLSVAGRPTRPLLTAGRVVTLGVALGAAVWAIVARRRRR